MKRLISAIASIFVLVACGGISPSSDDRSAIDIDQPPFLDQDQGLFPADLIRGIPAMMAMPAAAFDLSGATHTPRFAVVCGNGTMTLDGAIRTPSFTLSFDLALATLADQNVLSVGPFDRSALDVRVRDQALQVTVHGQTMNWGRLPWPAVGQHIDITLYPSGMVTLEVNNRMAAVRYGAFGPFGASMLRFGGEKGTLPGMCGAIDNLELYDHQSYDLGGGRTAEPSNPWLFKYDFDGPANNSGRASYELTFNGFAGLLDG